MVDKNLDIIPIISEWETLTGFRMENGIAKALYARDVNSYIMIYAGDVKTKGADVGFPDNLLSVFSELEYNISPF